MRLTLLFLLTTCFATYSQKYTATFGKGGQIENIKLKVIEKEKGKYKESEKINYPSILSTAEIGINIDKIEVPDSRFLQQLKDFQLKLNKPEDPFLLGLIRNSADEVSAFLATDLSKIAVFKYDITNVLFPLLAGTKENVKKLVCEKCLPALTGPPYRIIIDSDTPKSFDYKITLNNLDNDILVKHLEKTKSWYKPINLEHLIFLRSIQKDFRKEVKKVIDQFRKDLRESRDFNSSLISRMISIKMETKYIESAYQEALYDNREWISAWLWYTSGNVQLNPFGVTNDTSLVLSRIDEEIRELEDEQKLLLVMLGHDKKMLEEINARSVQISNSISDLRLRREVASQLADKLKAWRDQVQQKDKLLYSGMWHTSDEDSIQWIHHYDAEKNFKYLSDKDSLPSMVGNKDQVVTEIHNVKEGKQVKMVSALSEFQPKSELQISLEEIEKLSKGANVAAANLSGWIGTLAPISNGILPWSKTQGKNTGQKNGFRPSDKKDVKRINYLKHVRKELLTLRFDDAKKDSILYSLIDKCPDPTAKIDLVDLMHADRLDFVAILYYNFAIEAIEDYRRVIYELGETEVKLDWLLKQTTPILKIELKEDKTPEFRTVAEYPEKRLDITSSKTVTYELFLDGGKEAEVTKGYSKYNQTRVLPTVGLAYIPMNRTAAIFSQTTGQFEPGKRFDNVEAFVGVKVYISKHKPNPVRHTPTRRIIVNHLNWKANSIRGNTFVNTLFLTGGLGVRHQFLRNYYLGTGLDLFPGVNAHVGGNFILQKRYQLANGRILNEQEVPKTFLYISISLDPGIVASLTNIFIK